MDLSAIALQGLDQAQAQLEAATTGIASAAASPSDTVDLSAEVVALLSAKNQFSLDLTALKIANQTQRNAVDLIA